MLLQGVDYVAIVLTEVRVPGSGENTATRAAAGAGAGAGAELGQVRQQVGPKETGAGAGVL